MDVDKAFDISERENPSIRRAKFTEAANRAQIQEARAARRPTVSLAGQVGYTGAVYPFDRHNYQEAAARVEVNVARRSVIHSVSQAWAQRHAAQINVNTQAAAVRAANATFEGMRVDYRAGLRQTLDVLIAEETLRDTKIALAGAKHDGYVTEASLLVAVGRLEARILVQGMYLYQPEASFRRVEHIGSVPWSVIPAALDKLGEPETRLGAPVPELKSPCGSVRMAPSDSKAEADESPEVMK